MESLILQPEQQATECNTVAASSTTISADCEELLANVQIEEQDHQQLTEDVTNDLLFGEIEFSYNENRLDRPSHSMKKQQQYEKHRQLHHDKDFLKDKWKGRKDRVNKRLEGLSNEEKFEERTKRKEQIQSEKQNQQDGFLSGIPLIIDCSYDQYMTVREIRSLAIQILLTTEAQRRNKYPFQVNVCSASEKLRSFMTSQQFKQLPYNVYTEDILSVDRFREKQSQIVYLSPESENDLETVDASGETIYVVGGLIDRSVKKWASFDRANSLRVKSARLPINPYLTDLTRRCLNIDTVTIIMAMAVDLKFDWKAATLSVLGNRKIKEELKADQKDLILATKEKYSKSVLDKNNFIRDALRSIENKEKLIKDSNVIQGCLDDIPENGQEAKEEEERNVEEQGNDGIKRDEEEKDVNE